jgi:Domain of unknown function (DUF3598)
MNPSTIMRWPLASGFLLISLASGVASLTTRECLFVLPVPCTRTADFGLNQRERFTLSVGNVDGLAVDDQDEESIQWDLFHRHVGTWRGIWTTYDAMGDTIDQTVAAVKLTVDTSTEEEMIHQTHDMYVGGTVSDCDTCFDRLAVKTLPVATYTAKNLSRRTRLTSCGIVNGPSILRTGSMATEVGLVYGDGRIRVIFSHAPAFSKDSSDYTESANQRALKLYRVTICREAQRDTPPTALSERINPPMSPPNPVFFRPVPPFIYRKPWFGTSWTWGPQSGDRGWSVPLLDDDSDDAWHGVADTNLWNLRLGSIHVQAPSVLTAESVGLFRLAWLPNDDTLLRIEAGVLALQPLEDSQGSGDDEVVALAPPILASLRCDSFQSASLGNSETTTSGEPASTPLSTTKSWE